jgi:hypothetical protein
MWFGTIVENSLEDKSILDIVHKEKTWTSSRWTLHNISTSEEVVRSIGKYLASGPWYIHFWKPENDEILVIFKHKTFTISHSDTSTWEDAIQYGMSIGIPKEQLDFVIPD